MMGRLCATFIVGLAMAGCAAGAGDDTGSAASGADTADTTDTSDTPRRATETWQPLHGQWGRIVGELGSLDFDAGRPCGGDDTPFCFSGTLADGMPIHGAYMVYAGRLSIRYTAPDGTVVTRFLDLQPLAPTSEDMTMDLYERGTLVASMYRCASPDACGDVIWKP